MDLNVKGKSVLVFASSKGIGRAIAGEFAAEGASVVLASRDINTLETAVGEIQAHTGNPQIACCRCDMTRAEDIEAALAFANEKHGAIDVLINNSGGPPAGGIDQFEDGDWQNAYELNLLSYVRAIRGVLPYMRAQGGGHILNVTSSSIKQSLDNLLLSNTFRAGVLGLAKSLAQELAKDNILINTLGPGRIATDRVESLDRLAAKEKQMSYEDVKQASEKSIPLGRYGKPEEFAKHTVFLCSGANTYVTGQAFLVDGGLVKAL